jgi:hypothetical protein
MYSKNAAYSHFQGTCSRGGLRLWIFEDFRVAFWYGGILMSVCAMMWFKTGGASEGIQAEAPRRGLMERICRAISEDNEEEVIRLLDADPALLEREQYDGDRPLAFAAATGHLGVVLLLIERGANINATGDGGNTALHWTAVQGHEEVVALLLEKGAHANTRDNYGRTPLMLACVNGHLGVVKVLVQHMGGQGLADRSNASGRTVLHFAACLGHEEVVRCLLLAGADPTITENRGRTPRALAEQIDDYSETTREGRARCVAVFQARPRTC